MAETEVGVSTGLTKSQCWECLRRRWVCDAARPVCKKCATHGVVCPGYDDKKPLRWLAPGKVLSRNRKRTDTKHQSKRTGTCRMETQAVYGGPTCRAPPQFHDIRLSKLLSADPCGVATETTAIVQAVYYYNACIYPDFASVKQLAPNPYLNLVPLDVLSFLTPSLRHTLVFMALSHRISQMSQGESRHALAGMWSRLYQHRGMAIKALQEVVANERSHNLNLTLIDVLVFCFGELRQSVSPTWRQHFEGALKLIQLLGGLKPVWDNPHMTALVFYFLVLAVMANTTSPSFDQITWSSQPDFVNIVTEFYGNGLLPVLLCPPSLFRDIFQVNCLRSSKHNDSTRDQARTTLQRITSFSPEGWADSNGSSATCRRDDWLLLGRLYQSAVALYCMASLQSLGILKSDPELESLEMTHRARLLFSLDIALEDPRMKLWMMWPLAVAGMEAVHSGPVERNFVSQKLAVMAKDLGSPLPLVAKDALSAFWASGKTGWDECFDGAYAFVS